MRKTGRVGMTRHVQIFLGLFLGAFLGVFFHYNFSDSWVAQTLTQVASPLGKLFVQSIFMVVVPLVFSSVVLGIYELGDIGNLGRLGGRFFLFILTSAFLAISVGALSVALFQPAVGINAQALLSSVGGAEQVASISSNASQTKSAGELLLTMIPKNPLEAAVNAFNGDLIAFMVFCAIFGLALLMVRPPSGQKKDALVESLETLQAVCLKIVDLVMKLAPIGVGALIFTLSIQFGWELLSGVGRYVLVVLFALALYQFVGFSIWLLILTKKSPKAFFSSIRSVMLTAFSTASSGATLPLALKTAKDNLKLNSSSTSFVLSLGATTNQVGTACFQAATILFLAQLFEVQLGMMEWGTLFLLSGLSGIGTVGVPGGSLPVIAVVLKIFGIPVEGIALIIGVDRILDMSRTVINVTGDLVAAQVLENIQEQEHHRGALVPQAQTT